MLPNTLPTLAFPKVAEMSSEPPPPASAPAAAAATTEGLEADLSAATISKKQQKKDARKSEKAEKAAASQRQTQQQQQPQAEADDPFAANYGDVPVEEIQSKAISGRVWTDVGDLGEADAGRSVLIRGAAQAMRPVSKKMAFLVMRQSMSTVQCVLVATAEAGVSTQMVRFATSLSKESIVDVEGVVSVPKEPLKATTQQVEIQVRKVYCINRAIPTLPINLEDAARSEAEFEKAEQACSLSVKKSAYVLPPALPTARSSTTAHRGAGSNTRRLLRVEVSDTRR